ncbi:MAG: ABC transporter ATP-binding protein [Myxococcales bacterium]|nr:MAG: ABC transporter ATP-binding protein [Myxococcales bacterium]
MCVATALLLSSSGLQSLAIAESDFISFFAAAFFLYRPLTRFSLMVQASAAGFAALDRIQELLSKPSHAEGHEAKEARELSEKAALRVENLNAGYHDKAVLKNISFKVEQGQTLAIVGSSGAGKVHYLQRCLAISR